MVSLWSLHKSHKYSGRAYFKKGWASLFLPNLIHSALDVHEQCNLKWFIITFLVTYYHEELHLIFYRQRKWHNAEVTVITPLSEKLAVATIADREWLEEWMSLFRDVDRWYPERTYEEVTQL